MSDVIALPRCPKCNGFTVASTIGTGERARGAVARCVRRGLCDGSVPLDFELWEAHIRPRDSLASLTAEMDFTSASAGSC